MTSEVLIAILGSTAVSSVVTWLISIAGWAARGKSQRSMDSLLALEEASQKMQPKGGGEISSIKENQLAYINVLMANELARRMIPLASSWNIAGMFVSYVALFFLAFLLLLEGVIKEWLFWGFISFFAIIFSFVYLKAEDEKTKQKRERVDLARGMVDGYLETESLKNSKSSNQKFNYPFKVEEMIPYPGRSALESLVGFFQKNDRAGSKTREDSNGADGARGC